MDREITNQQLEDEMQSFGVDKEVAWIERSEGFSKKIKTVGVVGGGTSGYLAALTLRALVPDVHVTLIESKTIPIIGVGEATVSSIVTFLHKTLGIDIHRFYREVTPTWKLGIRFDWGQPEPYHFMAPFDWHVGSVGLLGSLAYEGSVNSMSMMSLLMEAERVPVLEVDGEALSMMPIYPFAYHLDNGRFVAFLHEIAEAAGIVHLDRTIVDADVDAGGQNITALRASTGETYSFDLYVDCSGFRSLLLEGKLGTPFHSYASSLPTDRALAFNTPHGGHIRPYTTALTMDAGWCWSIPMVESDHRGYVFSSSHLTVEEADAEIQRRFPDAGERRLVKFRSGRHDQIWRGNVFAVGNSYGFVEPLESTGILMITKACALLAQVVARSTGDGEMHRKLLNESAGTSWDRLRWFLAGHYRFNARLDTPFWRFVRAECDISGLERFVALYREGAPVRLRGKGLASLIAAEAGVFYGLEGLDCILLGQKVPTNIIAPVEPRAAWEERKAIALAACKRALTMQDTLRVIEKHPEILDDFLGDGSWVENSPPILV